MQLHILRIGTKNSGWNGPNLLILWYWLGLHMFRLISGVLSNFIPVQDFFLKFFNGYHGHAQHHRPSHLIESTVSNYKRGEQNLEEIEEQNKRIVSFMNFTESLYKCHAYS